MYDAWEQMLVTWRGDIGFHEDFDIYSSYSDAVSDQNAWQFCNGNDKGIGFPHDCGPKSKTDHQWTSLAHVHSQTDYRFSVVEAVGGNA